MLGSVRPLARNGLRRIAQAQEMMVGMIQWMDRQGFEIAMPKENGFDWNSVCLELEIVFVRKPA